MVAKSKPVTAKNIIAKNIIAKKKRTASKGEAGRRPEPSGVQVGIPQVPVSTGSSRASNTFRGAMPVSG